ncbi:MAG: helix-hairpin-helix domain-containing protein [Cyclobacteriaceae bacterium]|nr:helix-hairpin-helix domain-containing protein [Cyclobacteriaceae bacterium]
MKRIRLWIRDLFGFSRNEANGFLVLLPLMFLILFSNSIYKQFFFNSPVVEESVNSELDSLLANWDYNPKKKDEATGYEFFPFDPNTADEEDLNTLGFGPLTKRIINYRAAGGKFKEPRDLLKLYGMDSSFFLAISPYIKIEVAEKRVSPKLTEKRAAKELVIYDLNEADTSAFKTVRGIGSVLAKRIIKYREALGGFASTNQLKEVYGLDSTVVALTLQHFRLNEDFKPSQIDINKATEKELSSHPYIRSKLAKTIITYRFQHGSFGEIADLLNLELMDQQTFDRVKSYLKAE